MVPTYGAVDGIFLFFYFIVERLLNVQQRLMYGLIDQHVNNMRDHQI